MEILNKTILMFLWCSSTGMVSQVNSTHRRQELDSLVYPSFLNPGSTSTVTVLSERPVNISYMQTRAVHDPADYYHSVSRNQHNRYQNNEFSMGKSQSRGFPFSRHQQRRPKGRGFSGRESFNPMEVLRIMRSQKMEFMQRLRNLKHEYRNQEAQRRLANRNSNSGDRMTRFLRSVIQKCINKFQKHTGKLEMFVEYRKQKLQTFLDIPMIASVMRSNDEYQYHPTRLYELENSSTHQLSQPDMRKYFKRFPNNYQ